MKDKILERRIKIGVTLLVLFVATVSTGISTLVITDKQITFGNTIEILDESVSIQGAIDSITDASETNQYEIILYPGIYTENIVLKDWVHLSGITDSHDIILQSNTGKLITWDSTGCTHGNSSVITNLRLTSTPTTPDVEIINSSAGKHVISDCYINVYPTSTSMTAVNISEGNTTISNCEFFFDQTGNATGTNKQRCIIVRGNGSIRVVANSKIEMNIEDYDDSAVSIGVHSSSTAEIIIDNCEIHMTSTNTTSFNGTFQAITIGSNTTHTNIQSNHIHLNCTSSAIFSTGNAYCYKSHTGNGAAIHSTGNRIIIEGFPFSYFAYVNEPNRVISHFDDIVALEEITGTGNVTSVNSHADGELYVETIDLVTKLNAYIDASYLVTGDIESLFDIIIDTNGSTGGMFHILDVALSRDITDVNITAVATYTGVDVIHQHIGAAASLSRGMLYDNVIYTNVTDSFNNTTSDVTIFSSDNDYIYIGSQLMFDNIIVVLNTTSSASIFQPGQEVFEYSTGGVTWASFSPGDDTNGFTQSGFIRFGRNSLSGWAKNDPHFSTLYYIRIQRTRNFLVTPPVESTIHIESVVSGDYYWNADGNISSNNLMLNLLTGALTDGDPTDAEIDAIVGSTPLNVGVGWSTYIKDNDANYLYQIVSDGTNWYYFNGTMAV